MYVNMYTHCFMGNQNHTHSYKHTSNMASAKSTPIHIQRGMRKWKQSQQVVCIYTGRCVYKKFKYLHTHLRTFFDKYSQSRLSAKTKVADFLCFVEHKRLWYLSEWYQKNNFYVFKKKLPFSLKN